MHGTEQALKAVLRFLYVDMHACLCLPSRDETIMSQVDDTQLRSVHLHSFSDASHAPYRFNNRKGVSGGAVFFERSLVRSLSRQQQALSLSSCEAELYGFAISVSGKRCVWEDWFTVFFLHFMRSMSQKKL